MVKWKLMLSTLPFVAAALGLKALLDAVLQFQGVVDFGDVGLVLTGAVFLVGFMLAGVMADYKESEKLPAELACTLETMEDSLDMALAAKPELEKLAPKQRLAELTDTLCDWLSRKVDHPGMFQALTAFAGVAQGLDKGGASGQATRVLGELHNLRKTVTRIGVISRTGFLASGYALLETLVVATVALLLLSRFKSPVAEYTLVTFVTLIFVYMLRLIRDIDDPFEYANDGSPGAAEVELFPLLEYQQRARARLVTAPRVEAPAVRVNG